MSAIIEGVLPGFREVFGYLLMSGGGGGIRVVQLESRDCNARESEVVG